MYTVTLWRVRVTTVAMEKQQYPLCVLLNYISLSTKQKTIVTQQCRRGEFMSPEKVK